MLEKIIGHRGASAYAPENTMAAFTKALFLGCKTIEFDVMCSADDVPFVIHDDNLKRTTNGKGEVGLVDAEYLAELDAGFWYSDRYKGESIPELKEVLQWLSQADMQANIEIKPYPKMQEKTAATVVSYIHRYWPHDKEMPLVSSFDHSVLSFCRSIAPEMPLGLLMHEWDDNWLAKAQQLSCYSVHLSQKIVTVERVKAIKEQGYVVCAYTVNRKRLANKLFKWGVDAIFSDYPDLLR